MNDLDFVIYKQGELNINTFVKNGRCLFTSYLSEAGKDMEVSEYLDHLGPEYVCVPYQEAATLIEKVEDRDIIHPWETITLEEWMDAFEELPPKRWSTVKGVEFFAFSEFFANNITTFYACVHNIEDAICFKAMRRFSSSYEKLADEVHQAVDSSKIDKCSVYDEISDLYQQ